MAEKRSSDEWFEIVMAVFLVGVVCALIASSGCQVHVQLRSAPTAEETK